MSKLKDILDDLQYALFSKRIKDLMLELIGDMEERETTDMALKSWTNEDYKAFGKNELKAELCQKVAEL